MKGVRLHAVFTKQTVWDYFHINRIVPRQKPAETALTLLKHPMVDLGVNEGLDDIESDSVESARFR